MEDWYQQLKEELQLFKDKPSFLLAVSGGLDSIFLTELFREAGQDFGIAHVNYGLREASDADAEFVKARAAALAVPYFEHIVASRPADNIQSWARQVRYKFFDEVLEKEGYQFVVLAQHHDDQVEQFFLKALRPSGAFSLGGMRRLDGNRYRPLLKCSKDQLRQFLEERKISWREDASNANPDKYRRNWLRNVWIPELLSQVPSAKDHIAATQSIIREAEEVQNELSNWFFKDLIKPFPYDIIRFDLKEYLKRELSDSILRSFLLPKGFSAEQVEEILLPRTSLETKHFMGRFDNDIEWRGDFIYIHPKEIPLRKEITIESIEELEALSYVKSISEVAVYEEDGALYLPKVANLFPISIRAVKTKDSIACLDGGRKHKQLKEIFKEAKLPLCLRKNIYTWESAIGVLYLESLRSRNYVHTSLNADGYYKIEIT